MSDSYVIAVDLGGTNLRVGAVTPEGKVFDLEKAKADAKSSTEVVLKNIGDAIKIVSDRIIKYEKNICGLALGFPGIVDPKQGIVYQSPHFPDWKNLAFAEYFQKNFPWPVKVDNDANLIALGESHFGVGKSLDNFVMITLGTGVGGAMIIDKKVHHGDSGFAGEFGHMVIESFGRECACGGRGCWEMYVSTQSFHYNLDHPDDEASRNRFLEKIGKDPSGFLSRSIPIKTFYDAAKDGDIFAYSCFKKMGYYLGVGIASLTNILGIENYVIGGGLSESWDLFIEMAKKEISQRTYQETASRIKIHKAQLGDESGLLGGSKLFL